MQPQARPADPARYGTAAAYGQQRPNGVVGNTTPWNVPVDIGLGPTVEMLAAGNRVILKPSYRTPGCAELSLAMIASTLLENYTRRL